MVQFGKRLHNAMVAEWGGKYIPYGKLKKIIEKMEQEKQEQKKTGGLSEMAWDGIERTDSGRVLHDSENDIASQLKIKTKNRQQQFSDFISKPADPELRVQHNLAKDKDIIVQISSDDDSIATSFEPCQVEGLQLEAEFFSLLDDSVTNCSVFFKKVEFECYWRMIECDNVAKRAAAVLQKLLEEMKQLQGTIKLKARKKEMASRKFEIEKNKSKLTLAYKDLYRKLCLLKRFKFDNVKAVHKILKKHDKISVHIKFSSAMYLKAADKMFLFSEQKIDKLITMVERSFQKNLLQGKGGKKSLLVESDALVLPQVKQEILLGGIYSGFFFATCILMTAMLVYLPFPDDQVMGTYLRSFFVYRGLSLVLLHLLLLTVDVAVWEKFRINFAFILSMEHCVGVRKERLYSYTTFSLVMTCVSFLVYCIISSPTLSGQMAFEKRIPVWSLQDREILPLTLLLLFATSFFNPAPLISKKRDSKNKSPRVWFLTTIFTMIVTPLYKVEFQHFFLADQLVSQGVALQDLAMTTCFYLGGNFLKEGTSCRAASYGGRIAVACAVIPSWIRAVQCARRYHDSLSSHKYGQVHPHLTNMGKYMVSIITLAVGCVARERPLWFPGYLVLAFISTVYAYTWDVVMDWGLVSFETGRAAFLLKDKSLLHEDDATPIQVKAFYVWCMVSNMFLRLAWAWGLAIRMEDPAIKVWIFGALEIFRRAQWNLLRMEHEHLGNVDQYRASREIPLPGTRDASTELTDDGHQPGGEGSMEDLEGGLNQESLQNGAEQLRVDTDGAGFVSLSYPSNEVTDVLTHHDTGEDKSGHSFKSFKSIDSQSRRTPSELNSVNEKPQTMVKRNSSDGSSGDVGSSGNVSKRLFSVEVTQKDEIARDEEENYLKAPVVGSDAIPMPFQGPSSSENGPLVQQSNRVGLIVWQSSLFKPLTMLKHPGTGPEVGLIGSLDNVVSNETERADRARSPFGALSQHALSPQHQDQPLGTAPTVVVEDKDEVSKKRHFLSHLLGKKSSLDEETFDQIVFGEDDSDHEEHEEESSHQQIMSPLARKISHLVSKESKVARDRLILKSNSSFSPLPLLQETHVAEQLSMSPGTPHLFEEGLPQSRASIVNSPLGASSPCTVSPGKLGGPESRRSSGDSGREHVGATPTNHILAPCEPDEATLIR